MSENYEQWVERAKMAEQTERYDDMAKVGSTEPVLYDFFVLM